MENNTNKIYQKIYYLTHKEDLSKKAKIRYLKNKEKIKERSKKRYLEKTDLIKKSNKLRYQKNRDNCLTKNKMWSLTHPEERKIIVKRYRDSHKEEIKEYNKKYHALNKDHYREYKKKWRQKNPEKIKTSRIKNKAKRAGAEGSYPPQAWIDLKEQYDNRCLDCGIHESELTNRRVAERYLTPDHIIPLSRDGTNWISNIQPLCLSCNIKNWKHYLKTGSQVDFRPTFKKV